ncbi:MAG: hypothetical protein KDC99_18760 [Cyclobacteriaceae bacterium]|nr:hypothetical protein [Cyclobacteriaceae bacterium]
MLKRTKKLKRDDLEELRKREELIKQHTLIVQALEYQKQLYIQQLFPKYGLDPNKQFNINLKTGRVSEEISSKK